MSTEKWSMVAAFPSQEEIVKRIRQRRPHDMFGFEVGNYLEALNFEAALEFLIEDAKTNPQARKDWVPTLCDRALVLERMKDYLPFAFAKAEGERGLSAMRSLKHFIAWTWLAGDRGLSEEIETYDGDDYGKAMLKKIGAHYGWSASSAATSP